MDYPPFADAVARFRSFLDQEGYRGSIGWVFPSDVLLVRGVWIIRPRPQPVVKEEVGSAYRRAVNRRLGVLFEMLCLAGETPWCHIFSPTDLDQAQRCMMPDGLKLSVPVSPQKGREVVDGAEWECLKEEDSAEVKEWIFEK